MQNGHLCRASELHAHLIDNQQIQRSVVIQYALFGCFGIMAPGAFHGAGQTHNVRQFHAGEMVADDAFRQRDRQMILPRAAAACQHQALPGVQNGWPVVGIAPVGCEVAGGFRVDLKIIFKLAATKAASNTRVVQQAGHVKFTQAGFDAALLRPDAGRTAGVFKSLYAAKIFAHQRELFVVSMLRTGYRAGVIRLPSLETPGKFMLFSESQFIAELCLLRSQVFTLFELIQI